MDARRSQSSTDGRRRRLLATQDSEDLLAEFEALAPQTSTVTAPIATVPAPDRPGLQRFISAQLWKHSLLMLTIVLVTAVAVWVENDPPNVVRQLADSGRPKVSHGLAGLFLLLAGQLSLLIGWIRSHSSVDFNGRYRCWKWLSGCLMATACLWITNVEQLLPELTRLVAEPIIGTIGAARRTVVVVPVAALSLWVLSRVIPDMGRNRWSQIAFTIAVITAAVRLLPADTTTSAWLALPALNGILLSATALILCSLLLHTRFVLYVSKDPPERRTSSARQSPATTEQSDDDESAAQVASADSNPSPKEEATPSVSPEPATEDSDTGHEPGVIPADWSDSVDDSKAGKSAERRRKRSKRRNRKAA